MIAATIFMLFGATLLLAALGAIAAHEEGITGWFSPEALMFLLLFTILILSTIRYWK